MPTLLHALADLLLPPVCLGCQQRMATGQRTRLVCAHCRSRLRALPSPRCERCAAPRLSTGRTDSTCRECRDWPAALLHARAACILQAPADALVHALKYEGWHALADAMGAHMARLSLPPMAHGVRVCVPVPTTPARLRERGYNQAELLARAFAKRTGRCVVHLLERVDRAASQTSLQPVRRRANVAGAFRADAARCCALRGRDAILIDDVLTTGATAVECVRVLMDAGIARVSLVTFARALDARRLTSNGGSSHP